MPAVKKSKSVSKPVASRKPRAVARKSKAPAAQPPANTVAPVAAPPAPAPVATPVIATPPAPLAPVPPPAPAPAAMPAVPPPGTRLTPEQRFRMIQETAYFMAKKDDYKKRPDEYWFAAEADVRAKVGKA